MKEEYFTGDVVELLNLTEQQISSIRSQTCNQNANPNRDAIGMRYKLFVKRFTILDKTTTQYYLLDWGHGGHFSGIVSPFQFTLYKRPITNWVKYFKLKAKEYIKKINYENTKVLHANNRRVLY
jgi:hypothetical protein